MSEQNIQQHQPVPAKSEEGGVFVGLELTDVLALFAQHWRWFVVSSIICLICGYIQVRRATPVYTRSAQIVIKDDYKKGGYSGNVDWFAGLGLGSAAINVQNEIVTLQSPSTFIEVVKRLELNTTYKLDGKWHNRPLYGDDLPIKFVFPQPDEHGVDRACGSFDFIVKTDGTMLLKNFSGRMGHSEKVIKASVGQTLNTPLGHIKMEAGPSLAQMAHPSSEICIHVSHTDVLSAAKSAAAGLSAGLEGKENSVVNLNYHDTHIQRAEDILNTLIDAYNDAWVEDKNKMTVATNNFIMERLEVIQRELNSVDGEISSYKSSNLMTDPNMVAGMFLQDANAASKHIDELNTQLYMAQYVRELVTNEKSKYTLLPINTGIGALDGQLSSYNQSILDRNRLVANSNEHNTLVKDLDLTLAQLRTALIGSIDNQVKFLNTQIKAAQQVESKANAGIADSPQQAKYLLSVERQQKVKEALYVFLLQKREENELSLAFTAYNTRVITPPMGSNAPVSPQSQRIYLIAFAIGLAIPAIILYLLEISNTRVRGRKDLEKLSVPFLGEIPYMGRDRKGGLTYWLRRMGFLRMKVSNESTRELVIKPHSRNIINEAFRVVRTNLDFMNVEAQGCQCIMVTSANPGSGKTYVSANLAASFSLRGKRALLLDFDLRRASASLYVGKPKKGISAYLSGKQDDWQSLVVPVEGYTGFDILPVGSMPPNPAELLASERTQNLMKELRETYDIIFVDCPPVEIVADASIISKLVDQTMFVIRVDLMEREFLPSIDNYYLEGKFSNMSILLNGSLNAYGRYGYHRYGYRYGYGYGYSNEGYGYGQGYGYTEEDEPKKK